MKLDAVETLVTVNNGGPDNIPVNRSRGSNYTGIHLLTQTPC